MPTLQTMKIPTPQSWDEFEKIALASLKIKWRSPNLQRHGRQGQSQNGVDIYGEDNLGRQAGIQCKNYSEIDLSIIEQEIEKAESYEPKLDSYYVAVALPNDVKLQQSVRLISQERIKNNKFTVGILFWEDLIDELTKNPEEFHAHYPQLRISNTEKHPNLLSIFDISFYGNKLKNDINLLFGEIGWMVGEYPLQIRTISLILQNCAINIFKEEDLNNFISNVIELENKCLLMPSSEEENSVRWRDVDAISTKITLETRSLVYRFQNIDLAVYQLAKELSYWDMNIYDKYTVDQNLILRYFKAIGANEESLTKVAEKVDIYNNTISTLNESQSFNKVYSLAKEHIVSLQISF